MFSHTFLRSITQDPYWQGVEDALKGNLPLYNHIPAYMEGYHSLSLAQPISVGLAA